MISDNHRSRSLPAGQLSTSRSFCIHARVPADDLQHSPAVRTLEDAGLPSRQAEAVTTTIRVANAEGTATKADISRLEARLAELETSLTWRMFSVVGGLLALVTALDRLLGN